MKLWILAGISCPSSAVACTTAVHRLLPESQLGFVPVAQPSHIETRGTHQFVVLRMCTIFPAVEVGTMRFVVAPFSRIAALLQDKEGSKPSALEEAKLEHPVWKLRTPEEAKKAWEQGLKESMV